MLFRGENKYLKKVKIAPDSRGLNYQMRIPYFQNVSLEKVLIL